MSSVIPAAQTILEILDRRAIEHPDRRAFLFLKDGETQEIELTYGELARKAKAIAARIQASNLQNASVATIYSFDAPLEFIAAFLGCLYAGAIAVPCYPPRNRRGIEDIESRLISAGAKAILTQNSLLSKLKSKFPDLLWIATDEVIEATAWVPPALDRDKIAFLQYTSGSTGIPKGVMVTHQCLLANQEMLRQAFAHTDEPIGVGWLPLFHDMGLIGKVLQAIYLGRPCILLSPIAFVQKPIRWLQAISRYRGTTSGGPNFAYDLLCRHVTEEQIQSLDLSSWDVAFCGAEPIRLETLEAFAAKFAPCGFRQTAFYPCYGMAEATLFISGGEKQKAPTVKYIEKAALAKNKVLLSPTPKQGFKPIIGCGKAWLDGKIAIVDPKTLKRCAPDRIGEIWASGSGIAKGYWQLPEDSDRAFGAYIDETQERPFLRTGDLGFLADGELFITGRLKDMMVFWGFNHYPQQIEQTVQQCHPALRSNSGAAFAVEVGGEERLAIAQEVERSYRQSLDVEAVVEAIRWAVFDEHFVDVCAIAFLPTGGIPKTSSGKIQRRLCQQKFIEGSLETIAEWRSPNNTDTDINSLMRRYLNPFTHLKRYFAIARERIRRLGIGEKPE